jgi:hypothetical protein
MLLGALYRTYEIGPASLSNSYAHIIRFTRIEWILLARSRCSGRSQMRSDEGTLANRALSALTATKASIEDGLRNLAEARKAHRKHDEKFYRDLNAFCRANNVSHVCEDDWKTRR